MPMAPVLFLTDRKKMALALCCLALIGTISFLLWDNHTAQQRHTQQALEKWRMVSEGNARNLSRFFAERRSDLEDISASWEAAAFFENRALGMSMKYGLGASLNAIGKLFDSYLARRRLGGAPAYDRIVFLEPSGKILAERSRPGLTDAAPCPVPKPSLFAPPYARFYFLECGGSLRLTASVPYVFKGKTAGHIFAFLNTRAIIREFLTLPDESPEKFVCMSFGNRYIFRPEGVPASLPEPNSLVQGVPREFSPGDALFPQAMLGVSFAIGDTPFSLVRFQSTEETLGARSFWTTPTSISLLVIVVLIGTGLLAAVNAQNLVLQARIEESAKRQRAIASQNRLLEQEIRERKKAEAALQKAESKYRSIFEDAVEGIYQSAPEGRFISVNPSLARMMGYQGPEQMVSEISDIATQFYASPEDRKRMLALLERDGRVENFETRARRRDGSQIWLSFNARSVIGEDGAPLYFEGMIVDITQRREMERAEREREAAERANRAKSQFLASMSHELRTPMNAILGMADLLWESELNNEQRKYVEIFRSAGRNLLLLLDDILDLNRVESERLRLENIPFSPAELVANACKVLSPLAQEKGLVLEYGIPEDPGRFLGDPNRISQILVNLISNAVKFTEKGRIDVLLSVHENPGSSRTELAFSVHDTGIGIPAELHEKIFETFMQADPTTTRRYGGGGLGLTISRRLSEIMGGRLDVSSTPGQGSTFTLTVPFERTRIVPRPEQDASRATGSLGTLPPQRILVAEDTENNRMLFSFYLKNTPHRIVIAENGSEAVEKFMREEFDMVFMDIQMPGMDGLEATRIIRDLERRENRPRTPVIALTAFAYNEDRENCLRAGCDDFLGKPFRKTQLLEYIERHGNTP